MHAFNSTSINGSNHDISVTERERNQAKFQLVVKYSFRTIDILFTFTSFGCALLLGLTNTFQVQILNVTQFCNDSIYHQSSPVPHSDSAVGASVLMLLFCGFVVLIRSKIEKKSFETFTRKLFWEYWIIVGHLTFLYTMVKSLQLITGIPRPYFFDNSTMKNFYCENNTDNVRLTLEIKELDMELRKSFPSCSAALYGYSFMFAFFYLDHLDVEPGVHAAQALIMLLSLFAISSLFQAWLNAENHLMDILVGLMLGMLHAVAATRAMFGRVFHLHEYITKKPVETELSPPDEQYDDDHDLGLDDAPPPSYEDAMQLPVLTRNNII